jgi:hypothetical protein
MAITHQTPSIRALCHPRHPCRLSPFPHFHTLPQSCFPSVAGLFERENGAFPHLPHSSRSTWPYDPERVWKVWKSADFERKIACHTPKSPRWQSVAMWKCSAPPPGHWGRPGTAPAPTHDVGTFPDTTVRRRPPPSRGSAVSPAARPFRELPYGCQTSITHRAQSKRSSRRGPSGSSRVRGAATGAPPVLGQRPSSCLRQ